MASRALFLIARSELASSSRGLWIIAYPLSFFLIGASITQFSLLGVSSLGLEAVGSITSAIINVAVYFAALISLVLGGLSIVSERENRSLEWLCTEPISRGELLLGKFLGLLTVISATTILGLSLAGCMLAFFFPASSLLKYAQFIPVTILLSAAFLAVGMLVSSLSRDRLAALGAVFGLWLLSIFAYDLIMMYLTISFSLGQVAVFVLTIVNPAEAARILMLYVTDPYLTLLGSAGIYAGRDLGPLLPALTLVVLTGYAAIALFAANLAFERTDLL